MKFNSDYKSRFRILKGGKISLVVSALLGSVTLLSAAPSGGVVTSGSATISNVGKTTNITQSTQKASINWNKFNIAHDETVNFRQPDVNSITLNRVVGNERSIINGALNANGQVWLLNSNGVLFGKGASINTAGLIATTKELSDADFIAGKYNFKGTSTESVINLGTIDISDSGYATLLANTVSNEGTIRAVRGSVRLVGAEEVTINLNGNSIIDLTVNKGVLDALVENKGAVYADGGEIYLTTNAVDELLKGVVNNTGIIEANSLDGITGYVELFAHGGEIQVGGTIKVLDGFVETSGKDFAFNDAKIEAGKWLIDPVYITIDSALAGAIATQLQSGDVTIETNKVNTPSTTDNETESLSHGDIFVASNINYTGTTQSTLTLKAYRNIVFAEKYGTIANPFTMTGSISSENAALNVVLWSHVDSTRGSVWLPTGSSIKTNGGNITIGGGTDPLTGYAFSGADWSNESNAAYRGVTINGLLNAEGGDISIKAEGPTSGMSAGRGISIGGTISTKDSGNITIDAISHTTSDAIGLGDSNPGTINIENGTLRLNGTKGTGANAINVSKPGSAINISGSGSLIANATGQINLGAVQINKTGNATSNITLNATDSIISSGSFKIEATEGKLNTTLLADSDANNVGGIAFTGASTIDTNGGDIDIKGYGIDVSSSSIVSGDVKMTTAGASINLGAISAISGNIDTGTASGDIFVNGAITSNSNEKITLKAGNKIFVNKTIENTNSSDGGIFFDAANGVTFGADGKVIIHNINQLQWMNQAVRGKYELGSDIDASVTSSWNSGKGWNPIGQTSNFAGKFDGLGHTISNLTIDRPDEDNVGLFGYIGSWNTHFIENVILKDVDIKGQNNVGALVGSGNDIHIENASSSGKVVGNNNVGGLVGKMTNADETLLKSNSSASVSGVNNVGGLVGNLNNSAVRESYATGKVTGTGENIGGLVGYSKWGTGTYIGNSYATGTVSGVDNVGGLVGYNEWSIIENSYASGTVTGTTKVGGLVGYDDGDTTNSFYDKTVNIDMADEATYGKTTAELKNKSTFTDWNLQEDNTVLKGTPFLAWQKSGNSYTKTWVIGTKGSTPDTKPDVKQETKDAQKVIIAIVNEQATRVEPPKIDANTPNSDGKNVNITFENGGNNMLVSKPIEGQATKRVSLSEAKEMQVEAGNDSAEVRVPLSRDSIIQLVDGGISLPDGVEQEFYMANSN